MSQLIEDFKLEDLPNFGNAAKLYLMPEATLKRLYDFLNALNRLEVKFGGSLAKINKYGDKFVISIEDTGLAEVKASIAQLQNDYTELKTDENGDLVFDPGGGLGTERVDGNSGGLGPDRNDYNTGFSGGTSGGGSNGGSPSGDGGSNSDSSEDGGGGDSELNPEGSGVRVVANTSTQNPQLVGGSVVVQAIGTVYNFSGTPESSVVWTVSPVDGVDAASKPGPLTSFTFTEAGQYILTLTASVAGTTYSDTRRITVISEDTVAVSAGGDLSLDLDSSESINLGGSVTAGYTVQWQQASGPAAAVADPSSPTTSVTFQEPGTYRFNIVLLEDPTKTDSMYVTVSGGEPLKVSINPATITTYTDALPASAQLRAYVSQGSAALQWTKVSGPGTATFSSNSAITSVTMSASGWYRFRITATYEGQSASAEVSVNAGTTPSNFKGFAIINGTGRIRLSMPVNSYVNGQDSGAGGVTFVQATGVVILEDPNPSLSSGFGIKESSLPNVEPGNISSIEMQIGDPNLPSPGAGGATVVGFSYQGGGTYRFDGTFTPA